MRTAKFKLEELTCPSCVKKIEGVVLNQKGVTEAKVLFNSSKVKVVFDEHVITADQLAAVIQKLGYPVLDSKVS